MASGFPFPVVLLSLDPKMPLLFFTLLETQLCLFPGTPIFQVSGPALSNPQAHLSHTVCIPHPPPPPPTSLSQA